MKGRKRVQDLIHSDTSVGFGKQFVLEWECDEEGALISLGGHWSLRLKFEGQKETKKHLGYICGGEMNEGIIENGRCAL